MNYPLKTNANHYIVELDDNGNPIETVNQNRIITDINGNSIKLRSYVAKHN